MTRDEFIAWLRRRREIAVGENSAGRGGDALRVLMASETLEHAVLSDHDAEVAEIAWQLAHAEAAFSRKVFVTDASKRNRKQRDDSAVHADRNKSIADSYVKYVAGDRSRTPIVVKNIASTNDLTEAQIRRILKQRGVFLPSR